MDSVQFLLYVLKRIGVMIMVNLLGAITALIFVPSLASFFKDTGDKTGVVHRFLISDTGGSIIGWLVMLILLVWLFYDDGKKHTAYEIWSSINVTIVLIMMFIVYFVPSVFENSFHAESKGKFFYSVLYAPVKWLENKYDMAHTSAAGIGMGIILIVLFVVYVLSYKLYMRKHKQLHISLQ